MSLDLAPGIYHGVLVEVVEAEGTGLVGDHALGATTLTVAAGGFRDFGSVRIAGETYAYTRVDDILTITPGLVAAAEDGTPVESLTPAGAVESQTVAIVDLDMTGEVSGEDLPRAWIPGELAGFYPLGAESAGAMVSVEDTTYGYRLVGRPTDAPVLDGSVIDPATLPTPSLTDGDAPDNAPTVTFIGGIGSVFFRWTEITNADPVTYRLHVRAGSAPTTDGTYEVAAGVGLTSASVRKLKDGTAIVGDGSVTYYGIVTVEDADGPGPASAAVSGIPAQVTGPDIAVGAVTTDELVFNSGWGTELNGETITGTTITGSTITGGLVRTADPDVDDGYQVVMQPSLAGGELQFDPGGTVIPGAIYGETLGTAERLRIETPRTSSLGSAYLLVAHDSADGYPFSILLNANRVTFAATAPFGDPLSYTKLSLASGAGDGIRATGPAGTEHLHLAAGMSSIGKTSSSSSTSNFSGVKVGATSTESVHVYCLDVARIRATTSSVTIYEADGTTAAITVTSTGATIADGSVGTGTFRDSVDARVTAVAPTVTMTTGSVGTGTFRDSVRAAVAEQDSGWLSASGSFTGSVRLIKRGDEIGVYGEVARATGFSTTFTSIGVTAPAWALAATNKQLPGAVATNGGSYQFRVNSGGAVEIRQSQAITQDMSANGSYLLT